MKHNIIVLFVLNYLLTTSCFGQVYLGLKAGLAPSTLSIQNPDSKIDKKTKWLNYLGGLVLEYPVIAGFSIQLEAQYTSKGYRLIANPERSTPFLEAGYYFSDYIDENQVNNINDDGVVQQNEAFFLSDLYKDKNIILHYIEIPLLFKYEFVGNLLGYYVEIGPYYARGIKGIGEISIKDIIGNKEFIASDIQKEYPDVSSDYLRIPIGRDGSDAFVYDFLVESYLQQVERKDFFEFDSFDQSRKSNKSEQLVTTDYLNRNDIGFNIGGGIALDMGESRFYFGLRYAYGTFNLGDSKQNVHRNHSFQASATYVYPFGGY